MQTWVNSNPRVNFPHIFPQEKLLHCIAISSDTFSNFYFSKSNESKFMKFLHSGRPRLYLLKKKKLNDLPFAPHIQVVSWASHRWIHKLFSTVFVEWLPQYSPSKRPSCADECTLSPWDNSITSSPMDWGRAPRWSFVSHDESGHFFH